MLAFLVSETPDLVTQERRRHPAILRFMTSPGILNMYT
jgi:hypothetical protein